MLEIAYFSCHIFIKKSFHLWTFLLSVFFFHKKVVWPHHSVLWIVVFIISIPGGDSQAKKINLQRPTLSVRMVNKLKMIQTCWVWNTKFKEATMRLPSRKIKTLNKRLDEGISSFSASNWKIIKKDGGFRLTSATNWSLKRQK